MKLPGTLFAVVVLTVVIGFLSMWFYPTVQDFMTANRAWNGMKEFVRVSGATEVTSISDLSGIPQDSAIVLIAYIRLDEAELAGIKRFVGGGGTLILMEKYGYGNEVLSYLGLPARFTNQPLVDPLFSFKNESMPLITDFAPGVEEQGIHVVILNRPTSLTGIEQSQALAWSSKASFLDTNGDGALDQNESIGPVPVAASFRSGKGTVAVVSDPSIVINSMLQKEDNYRFVQYLASRGGKEMNIFIANSHLKASPLDISKTRLNDLREVMRSPYALLGIVGLIFVLVSKYTVWKGKSVDW